MSHMAIPEQERARIAHFRGQSSGGGFATYNHALPLHVLTLLMKPERLYRVTFMNQGQVYELYARGVSHGSMLGFVEIEHFVFGERSAIVLDPSEEKLKTEFAGVERSYVPVHAIVRIDEVSKQGQARIHAGGESAKLVPFPVFTPPKI